MNAWGVASAGNAVRPDCEELLVGIHDEALSGLGLTWMMWRILPSGQNGILFENEFLRARVEHVDPQPSGRYVVGFSCERIVSQRDRGNRYERE